PAWPYARGRCCSHRREKRHAASGNSGELRPLETSDNAWNKARAFATKRNRSLLHGTRIYLIVKKTGRLYRTNLTIFRLFLAAHSILRPDREEIRSENGAEGPFLESTPEPEKRFAQKTKKPATHRRFGWLSRVPLQPATVAAAAATENRD